MSAATPHAHAIVMRRYGAPDVLAWEEVAVSPFAPDEVRIRTIPSAVNHSDLARLRSKRAEGAGAQAAQDGSPP